LQLKQQNTKLDRENKRLYDENRFLTEINNAFANENDELRESLDHYSKIRLPKSLTDERPPKRHKLTKKKSKGKRAAHFSDDESKDSSTSEDNESERNKRNEKKARVCLISNKPVC